MVVDHGLHTRRTFEACGTLSGGVRENCVSLNTVVVAN